MEYFSQIPLCEITKYFDNVDYCNFGDILKALIKVREESGNNNEDYFFITKKLLEEEEGDNIN